MNYIYTIGFTKKTAKHFFELLIANKIKRVIDIRLNNSSQLAGFAKGNDLDFFLKKIADIEYIHIPYLAPTKEILDAYKKNIIKWSDYELRYAELMKKRNITDYILQKGKLFWAGSCLLCSEDTPEKCHRRLVAEMISKQFGDIKEKDLI